MSKATIIILYLFEMTFLKMPKMITPPKSGKILFYIKLLIIHIFVHELYKYI